MTEMIISSGRAGIKSPSYAAFLERKAQVTTFDGFKPLWLPQCSPSRLFHSLNPTRHCRTLVHPATVV